MKKSALSRVFTWVLLLLMVAKPISAQESHPSTSADPAPAPLEELCNQVIFAIYQDIAAVKSKYAELEQFGPYVLSQNQYGIYSLEYEYIVPEGFRKGERAAFAVTIVRMEDTNFRQHGDQAFNLGFPLLDLKFAGYQEMLMRQNAFDIQNVIQKNGDLLLEEQNKLLPLKLTMETIKDSYWVGEDIEILVTLENVSSKNFWVKELNKETLFFIYGDTPWGAQEIGRKKSNKIKKRVLEPGQKITAKFVGSGFLEPQVVKIFGSYAVTFKGVNPTNFIKVVIHKQ